MEIIPLSEKYLDQAIELCNRVFPDDINSKNPPELGFKASLNKEEYKWYWEKHNCIRIEYFLLISDKEKILGTTGVYAKSDNPNIAWLGWFCVDPDERGNGYGEKLLNFSIEKASKYGYNYLKVYTNPDESPSALKLYEKVGFKTGELGYDPADKSRTVLFLEKKL